MGCIEIFEEDNIRLYIDKFNRNMGCIEITQ